MPWRAEDAQAHPASLYLEAGDWSDAASAVRSIESWRRIPQPLLWMTRACWHLHGLDAAWPLLAEALWLAPGRAASLIAQLPDQRLARLARSFEADFEPEDDHAWSWLPSWALIDQPALPAVLAGAVAGVDTPAEQAFKLVMALLRMERAGRHHEIVEHRRQLKALSEPFFAVYMRSR